MAYYTGSNITTRFGYTGDSLPEDHPLYDFDGTFRISARVTQGRPATYYEPAEGGDCEITSVVLESPRHERREKNETIAALFDALIDSDKDLKDAVFGAIGEEFHEMLASRGYDG